MTIYFNDLSVNFRHYKLNSIDFLESDTVLPAYFRMLQSLCAVIQKEKILPFQISYFGYILFSLFDIPLPHFSIWWIFILVFQIWLHVISFVEPVNSPGWDNCSFINSWNVVEWFSMCNYKMCWNLLWQMYTSYIWFPHPLGFLLHTTEIHCWSKRCF